MEIKLENHNISTISSAKYTNKNNSEISFKDCLNKVAMKDQNETLIEDKKLYDSLNCISNIKFGNKEWEAWKEELTYNCFPPLNAPAVVREAWREVKENISNEDTKSKDAFHYNELVFFCQSHYPDLLGLPANFKLNAINDYKTLFNLDIAKNQKLAEIYKNNSEDDKYTLFAKLIKDVDNKLDEKLFRLK